ncbi:nitroreductase [Halioglobus maricola]|uniref:Nitroreductase n=1 Tax=Halioglobus maricola TaxID=2601894 RepID=A0A5P9NJ72_9GAMM|nr:nitroreductase [Halioglobus maricola]QFU75817.1 nitroreductase [Halioglobus maricola]
MSETSEIFQSVVRARRSLRAFKPQAVDKALLEKIFATAQWAPSNCNTQPWKVHVASGDVLEKLRSELPARFTNGDISMDFPYDGQYDGVYKDRQFGAAMAMYAAAGIAREDKPARHEQFMQNFTFFGAPHVAFLFLPEPFSLREAADLGMFAQTLMLTLTANDLGSCPQTALGFHANFVREVLGAEESDKLVFGISFGYPEEDAAVNDCQTDRAEGNAAVQFHN